MKRLLYTVFIFNFLFSLLTAILPLLVYEISEDAGTSGSVLTAFMLALLGSRFLLFKMYIREGRLLKFGLAFYSFGFALLIFNSSHLVTFYIGAIFFGVGVGVVAPALLTLITNASQKPTLAVGLHNSFMGVASATAPFLGLFLFYSMEDKRYLYAVLFCIALTILIPSLLVEKTGEIHKKSDRFIKKFDKQLLKLDYLSNYLSFLLTSVSYGSIIAFLPILLEQINLRIDVFYLFFWTSFILSQIYMTSICRYISEKIVMSFSILSITITTLLLSITSHYTLLILNAVLFGFCYGGLMNIFYNRIANIKDNKSKTDAFSIFGLMSYFGVGLGSFLLSSIASVSLPMVFMVAAIFPIIAFLVNILFSYFSRKRSKRSNMQMNVKA